MLHGYRHGVMTRGICGMAHRGIMVRRGVGVVIGDRHGIPDTTRDIIRVTIIIRHIMQVRQHIVRHPQEHIVRLDPDKAGMRLVAVRVMARKETQAIVHQEVAIKILRYLRVVVHQVEETPVFLRHQVVVIQKIADIPVSQAIVRIVIADILALLIPDAAVDIQAVEAVAVEAAEEVVTSVCNANYIGK